MWLAVLAASSGAVSTMAGAADPSYVNALTELVAEAEAPAITRDLCNSVMPEGATANSVAYNGWRTRNAELLALVQAERDRADKRAAKAAQGKPYFSTKNMVDWSRTSFFAKMKQQPLEKTLRRCAHYPEGVIAAEESTAAEIRKRLEAVHRADKP